MKKLALLFLLGAGCYAQTVPVTVTFNLPSASYLSDVEHARFITRNAAGAEGTVTTALTNSATSIVISGTCPANNVAIYVDSEPMLVTAGSGTNTCTVTRNSALSQAGTTAAAHSVGATVYELKYPTATTFFVQQGVAAFIVACINTLGSNSAVIGSNVTALSTNQTAIQTALANVAQ